MITPTSVSLVATLLLLTVTDSATAQRLVPLVIGDLRVSGVAVDDDSGAVRRRLGAPVHADATGWQYPDLRVFLKTGKVAILSITGPSRATPRGLRVGDPAARARTLYRPCYADSLVVQICYDTSDFDERAITAMLRGGRIIQINVGRIIEP